MIFPAEVVCLNFDFVGDEVCLHSTDCCFDLGALCDIHVSFPATTQLKTFSYSSLYCVSEEYVRVRCVQRTGLPFQFVFFRKHLQHPVCTQFLKLKFIRHNFVKK